MAFGHYHSLMVFLIIPSLITAGRIDNKLIGLPRVECVNGAIVFNFETETAFKGRVYVRGLEDGANCGRRFSQSISDQGNRTRFNLSIKTGECNMDRQRTQEGVAHSIMVVVAFHSVFETENDTAFRGVCFFRALRKIAGSLRGVAGSVSVVVENNGKALTRPFTADCTYTVRGETADGPLIRYAKVGDTLYHVWECAMRGETKRKQQSKKTKDLGILVHSCAVEDGRGARYALLDETGCPLDRGVGLPELEYENAITGSSPNVYRAVAQLRAYKFSRTTEVRFKCVVAICDRRQDQCDGVTPPRCERNQTKTVSSEKEDKRQDDPRQIDVIASMHVLDNFDEQLGEGGVPSSFFQHLNANSAKKPARCVAARCRSQSPGQSSWF